MSRRHLLTDEERAALFGVPTTRDSLAKLYTLDTADLELVRTRRTPANRLGSAAALTLLRHPGFAPAAVWPPPEPLVAYLAEQLGIDGRAFDDYARRPQTVGDFTLEIAAALGLRAPTRADVPFMIETAARAAWPTERGLSIAEGLVASLREARLILPSPDTIERAGLAGRARARKRATNALLAGFSDEQLAKLDAFVAVNPETGRAPLTWAKDVPSAPKAEHVREILDKLRAVPTLLITNYTSPFSLTSQVARFLSFPEAGFETSLKPTSGNDNSARGRCVSKTTQTVISQFIKPRMRAERERGHMSQWTVALSRGRQKA
jgi:hypothetical protein